MNLTYLNLMQIIIHNLIARSLAISLLRTPNITLHLTVNDKSHRVYVPIYGEWQR